MEQLKNRDFREIDFVESLPHSLLDFKKAFIKPFLKSINHCVYELLYTLF